MDTEIEKLRGIIGIDPGVNGGMSIWRHDDSVPKIWGWTRNRNEYNHELMSRILQRMHQECDVFQVGTIVSERPWKGAMRGGEFQTCLFNDIKRYCQIHSLKFEFIAPTSMKKKVTGSGKASKELVQAAVRDYFEMNDQTVPEMTTEHEFDATGMVIAHLRRRS